MKSAGDVEGNIGLLLHYQLGALNAGPGSQEGPFPKALKYGIIPGAQSIHKRIPYRGALAAPFQDIQIVLAMEKGEFLLRRLPRLNQSHRRKGEESVGPDEFISQFEPKDLQWVGEAIIVVCVSIGVDEGGPHESCFVFVKRDSSFVIRYSVFVISYLSFGI